MVLSHVITARIVPYSWLTERVSPLLSLWKELLLVVEQDRRKKSIQRAAQTVARHNKFGFGETAMNLSDMGELEPRQIHVRAPIIGDKQLCPSEANNYGVMVNTFVSKHHNLCLKSLQEIIPIIFKSQELNLTLILETPPHPAATSYEVPSTLNFS
ncbi:hypothetical protein V6N13_087982 [Hibiscus sabdariffa]|uniref:Uncharacterized protein n=1 Tax=Hibiscus sabdariffa TaxID=183260 RepID=A0ABR2FYI0_9ROSI